CARDENYFDYW
nr:immunoglobulin heavy chain junction region [Mus musculus]